MPRIEGTPWLTFAYRLGSTTTFIDQGWLTEFGKKPEQLETDAVTNLARTPASWKIMNPPGTPPGVVLVLMCQQPDGCERLVHRPFLQHAQRMIKDSMLAAVAPVRGVLVVAGTAMLNNLTNMANDLYSSGGDEALSPWCFAVADGVVKGRFTEDGLDLWT